MLPELTKLKITAVHCEHLLTHLVTGDGRKDVLVRPGYQLSSSQPWSTLSLPSSTKSSFMTEDRGNSYAHIVGVPPDDDDAMMMIMMMIGPGHVYTFQRRLKTYLFAA